MPRRTRLPTSDAPSTTPTFMMPAAWKEPSHDLLKWVKIHVIRGLAQQRERRSWWFFQRAARASYDATFMTDRDAVEYFNYDYPGCLAHSCDYTLMITRSKVNAQAITCAQYSQQIWPLTRLRTWQVLWHAIRDIIMGIIIGYFSLAYLSNTQ